MDWNKSQQESVGAPSFEEGDSVYLRRRTLGQRKFNIKTAKTSTKLDHLQIWPFTIKKKLNFVITARMKIPPVFHISLLQPIKTRKQTKISRDLHSLLTRNIKCYSYNR
jgi:hypothetical protein